MRKCKKDKLYIRRRQPGDYLNCTRLHGLTTACLHTLFAGAQMRGARRCYVLVRRGRPHRVLYFAAYKRQLRPFQRLHEIQDWQWAEAISNA